jgi:predicted HTH transcriptional regulator
MPNDYIHIISGGDSENVEFKKSTSELREATETICAFANTKEIRPSSVSFYYPGHLFAPAVTIESLRLIHPSKPGNKLLAKIFYQTGLFENWGGGTLKIIDECARVGLENPIFAFEGGMFRLTFLREKLKGKR